MRAVQHGHGRHTPCPARPATQWRTDRRVTEHLAPNQHPNSGGCVQNVLPFSLTFIGAEKYSSAPCPPRRSDLFLKKGLSLGSKPKSPAQSHILPGFESVPVRTVREAIEKRADAPPIFKSCLMERAAYRDIHISGMVPRQKDPRGGPAANVGALAAELLAFLEKLREAA
jgi:hypothetical protein